MPPKPPLDLLKNRPSANAELNANDGRIGCISLDGAHFITSLADVPHIPALPIGQVQVFADGHFGVHDPTRAPQFYDERIPHFGVFPVLPSDKDDPYYDHRHMWAVLGEGDIDWSYGAGGTTGIGLLKRRVFVQYRASVNWAVERADIYYDSERERASPNTKMIHFLDMRLPRLRQFLQRLESVANDLTSIRISANGLLRFWLDVSAGVDWVTMYQRVLRQERAFCDLPTLPTTLGVFTFDHNVVEMFSHTPNVPVYYIRPVARFNNQRILKVVPILEHDSCPPPPTPYPIIFTGSSDDPAKLGSQVRFLDRFLHFRTSAFDFVPSPPVMATSASPASSSVGPQRSAATMKGPREQTSKVPKKPKPKDSKARNLFEDCTRAPYSPPLHPGWSGTNLEVKTDAVEEKRRLQHQRKEPLLAAKYMLPPPGLFLRDGLPDEQFSSYLAQYNHIFSALIYRITSQHSHAPALSNQEWRDVLFLPRQRGREEGELTTHRQAALAKTAASLGDALSSSGVHFEPVCPTPAGGFKLPSLEDGRHAMWCLFELVFRFELVMLDNRLKDNSAVLTRLNANSESLDADEEAAAQQDRYAEILAVFPEDQLVTVSPARACEGLCSMDWACRAERLERLRRIMALWRVEKPTILKAPISTRESPQGLAQERALALLYAQTFYDTFERPAILPRAWT
ncbi:hypothetical protein BDZ89DRAFT_1062716 [Hymenopellis radicata]|nr:hypothetical protein BDZ89DRAFT_1062716 [Hymenopellis radicata]